MDKQQFDTIKTTLELRLKLCRDNLDRLSAKNSFVSLTIDDITKLKQFADEEINHQTRILQIDLYHIIGMANLSMTQLSVILKLVRNYSLYRPILHSLSSWDGSILNLPKLVKNTKYKSKEFGMSFLNNPKEEIDEEDSYDFDIMVASKPGSNVIESEDFGIYDGTNIKLTSEQIYPFAKTVASKKCFNISAENLYQAILAGKKFGGIQWMKKDSYYLGCPINSSIRTNIVKIFNKMA